VRPQQECVPQVADDLLTFPDDKDDDREPEDENRHEAETERSVEDFVATRIGCSALSSDTSTPTSLLGSTLLDSPITSLSPVLRPLTDTSTSTTSESAPSLAIRVEHEDHIEGEWRALTPRSPQSPESKAPSPALTFSTPFTDIEHNRLLGCAVFIESMNPSEAENFWRDMEVESFARASDERLGRGAVRSRNGGARGHVAEEWERYYLHVVRAIYLQRDTVEKGGKSMSLEVSEAEGSGADIGGLNKSVLSLGKEDVGTLKLAGLGHPMAEDRGRDLVGRLNAAPSDLVSQADHLGVSSTVAGDVSTLLMELDGSSDTGLEQTACEDLEEHPRPEQAAHAPLPSPKPERLETGKAGKTQRLGISSDTLIDPTALPTAPITLPEQKTCLRSPPSQPRAFQPSNVSELFYHPTSPLAESYRTVLVTNIPPAMSLATLLRKLHAYIDVLQHRETESEVESEGEGKPFEKAQGKIMILSASLHPTHYMRTCPPMKGNTARVVFSSAELAAEVVRAYHATTVATSGSRTSLWVDRTRLGIHLIPTPIRPCSPRLREEIARGLSRVLYLAFPASASHAVCGSARADNREDTTRTCSDSKTAVTNAVTDPSPAKPLLESLVASLSGCGIRAPMASGKFDRADGKQVFWFEFADVRDAGLGWAAVGQWYFAKGDVERGFLGEGEVYNHEQERELGANVERKA